MTCKCVESTVFFFCERAHSSTVTIGNSILQLLNLLVQGVLTITVSSHLSILFHCCCTACTLLFMAARKRSSKGCHSSKGSSIPVLNHCLINFNFLSFEQIFIPGFWVLIAVMIISLVMYSHTSSIRICLSTGSSCNARCTCRGM